MQQNEQEPIGRLIYMTTMAIKNYLDTRLKPYDLTIEQFQVLKSLGEENGIVQSRVCALVDKSPANMTRILDRLEKKGCLERRGNPEDRRSSLVFLTGEGEALLAEVILFLSECNDTIIANLSDEELMLIRRGLKTITANVQQFTTEGIANEECDEE